MVQLPYSSTEVLVTFSLHCINQLCLPVIFPLYLTTSGHGVFIKKLDFNCVLFNIYKVPLVEYSF